MSISIPQPAMAIHSHDVPGYHYRMWNTWEVPAATGASHILGWAGEVGKRAAGGKLKAVIINCHGIYGSNGCGGSTGGYGLSVGTGIRRAHTPLFASLRDRTEKIIITACGTARISQPGATGDGDGNLFCQEIARAAQTQVIAATTHQVGDLYLSYGNIDDWEGLVVTYGPDGNLTDSRDYGRGWVDGLLNGYD